MPNHDYKEKVVAIETLSLYLLTLWWIMKILDLSLPLEWTENSAFCSEAETVNDWNRYKMRSLLYDVWIKQSIKLF